MKDDETFAPDAREMHDLVALREAHVDAASAYRVALLDVLLGSLDRHDDRERAIRAAQEEPASVAIEELEEMMEEVYKAKGER